MSSYFSQTSPNPAGRPADNSAPAQPAPGQPAQGAPPGAPPAEGGGGPLGGGMMMFLLPLILIATMVFTSRSQSKRQKAVEASLKVGDQVVTNAGLIGKLIEVGERTVKLEIAPGVNVKVIKSSVQGSDAPDAKADDKKSDDKKSDDKKSDDKKSDDKKSDSKKTDDVVVAKDKPQEKKA